MADPLRDGVSAPDPVVLPDARRVFAPRAARLESLAEHHPMVEWLRFIAYLSRDQDATVADLPDAIQIEVAVARAVEARWPPLAAKRHRRDPIWREGLSLLLRRAADRSVPDAKR
jgi:FdhE protein